MPIFNQQFTLRAAEEADIDDIVNVDLLAFEEVYNAQGQNEEELRASLRDKFLGRLGIVGGEWMPVLERKGEIVGFMTCCPTSKTPEEFVSWEETTDNGTLETTYDSNGKNVYVVTLSVLPEGKQGKDMLFAHQIGKMLREGYDLGFFESRLSGLREWVLNSKCGGSTDVLEGLSEADKDAFANEYFESTIEVNGKWVRRERLIELYDRVGCKFIKVASNAYEDEPSMNYGVVCIYDGAKLFDGSDLGFKVPETLMTRKFFGLLLQAAARSPKMTRRIFA